jgi:hypothetical protein
MMKAASTSETSINFYQTTRRNIPEDSHLHAGYYLRSYWKILSLELQTSIDRSKIIVCCLLEGKSGNREHFADTFRTLFVTLFPSFAISLFISFFTSSFRCLFVCSLLSLSLSIFLVYDHTVFFTFFYFLYFQAGVTLFPEFSGQSESSDRSNMLPRFRICTVLFQYHKQHQYPISGHGISCRAGPLSCARSFTDSPHHFESGDYKLKPLMVYHSENLRAFICFPFYAAISRNATPRITRVTCIEITN